MSATTNVSSRHRILRGITPSAISAVLCVTIAAAITIGSAIAQSINVGTSLPETLDGNWGLAYTNTIVQPLASISNNAALQMGLVVFGWGITGLIVYLGVEYSTRTYRTLQDARQNVHLSTKGVIRGNVRPFVIATLWRAGVIAVFSILFALLAVPIMRSFAQNTSDLVLGQVPLSQSAVHIPLVILGVALLLHCALVFLRLFLMRMRLFHDISSYIKE